MKKELYDATRAAMDSFHGEVLEDDQQQALGDLNELADELTDCGKTFTDELEAANAAFVKGLG